MKSRNQITDVFIFFVLLATYCSFFSFQNFTSFEPKNTIIVVEGGIFSSDDFRSIGYTSLLKNATETLANMWGWDFHYFCRTINGLGSVSGDDVLLFIDGHGGVRNKKQLLGINGTYIDVMKIANRIKAKNLTVIVNSCYSVNYYYYFHHPSMTALYTNDRFNESHTVGFSYTYDSETGEIIFCHIHSFITSMLSYLYEGYSYTAAYQQYWMIYGKTSLSHIGTAYVIY